MTAYDELRRPPAATPEFVELADGTWLCRRLGLGATGATREAALHALLQKESLHTDPSLPVPQRLEAAELAGEWRIGVGAALACLEG
jgi:hypothetical protein